MCEKRARRSSQRRVYDSKRRADALVARGSGRRESDLDEPVNRRRGRDAGFRFEDDEAPDERARDVLDGVVGRERERPVGLSQRRCERIPRRGTTAGDDRAAILEDEPHQSVHFMLPPPNASIVWISTGCRREAAHGERSWNVRWLTNRRRSAVDPSRGSIHNYNAPLCPSARSTIS